MLLFQIPRLRQGVILHQDTGLDPAGRTCGVDHIGKLFVIHNTKALKSYDPSSHICALRKLHGYRSFNKLMAIQRQTTVNSPEVGTKLNTLLGCYLLRA